MNKKRPINLDLTTIKQPPTAIVSILHRASGFLVFLFIPFLLCVLASSLSSDVDFLRLKAELANPVVKFFLWVFLSGLLYHLVAGIRHLMMDMHIGETLPGAKKSAYGVMAISLILIVLAGVWIW